MSDAVSALNYATSKGFVMIEEQGLQGMITLRGDLSDPALKKAVKVAVGVDVPGQRRIEEKDGRAAAWMSPDELLLMMPYSEVTEKLAGVQKALAKVHALAVNVSDARVVIRLRGAGAREVLAKLAPVDLSSDGFQPGELRRTRLAQVPAAFWMPDEESFMLVAFRSVASYVFGALKTSALPGSEVGFLS